MLWTESRKLDHSDLSPGLCYFSWTSSFSSIGCLGPDQLESFRYSLRSNLGRSIENATNLRNIMIQTFIMVISQINLGCKEHDVEHEYQLYVTTFLGFGVNQAEEKYEEKLVDENDLKTKCLTAVQTAADSRVLVVILVEELTALRKTTEVRKWITFLA